MDETGWKVEAQLHWLWAVVTEQITFCEILPGRGFRASGIGNRVRGLVNPRRLGGVLQVLKAAHQVWRMIRRCRDLAAAATLRQRPVSLAVKQLLEEGLACGTVNGQRSRCGGVDGHRPAGNQMDRLLARTYREPANRRLAKHLRHERPYLFTFLYCPGLVDATNNLAERVMRMLVVIRKNWGGNRTGNGARAQAILTSVLCTARQQDKDVFELLTDLLRSRQPTARHPAGGGWERRGIRGRFGRCQGAGSGNPPRL
jgi:hypothetical protein